MASRDQTVSWAILFLCGLSWALSFWWVFLRGFLLVCPPSSYLQAAESTSSHSASLSTLIVHRSCLTQAAFLCLISNSSLSFSHLGNVYLSVSSSSTQWKRPSSPLVRGCHCWNSSIAGKHQCLACHYLHKTRVWRKFADYFSETFLKSLFLSIYTANIKIQIYFDSCQCNDTFPSALKYKLSRM